MARAFGFFLRLVGKKKATGVGFSSDKRMMD
jgi:hypothetical protein